MTIIGICECGQEYEKYRPNQIKCPDCLTNGKTKFALPPLDPPTFVRKVVKKAPEGQRIAILADLHFPFVDWAVWLGVRSCLDSFDPHVIVYNGDTLDNYSLSLYDKNPLRQFKAADEIREGRDFIATYRKRWGNAEHYWLDGNHEERFNTVLRKNPELAGLLSLHEALGLKELEFSTVPYGGVLDYLGFAITHGTRFSSLPNGTAKTYATVLGGSGVVAHSHRVGSYTYSNLRGTHTFYESGCLCRLDPDWVKQRPPNWQNGFLLSTVHHNALYVNPIVIHSKGFHAEGQFYKVR